PVSRGLRIPKIGILAAGTVIALGASVAACSGAPSLESVVDVARLARASPVAIPRYGVVERAFRANGAGAGNPWEDVRLDATLVSPSHRRVRIGGFYDGGSTWKFRFSPPEAGRWRWRAVMRGGRRRKAFC